MASFISLHRGKEFKTFLEKRLLQVAKLQCLSSQIDKLDNVDLQLRAFKKLEGKMEAGLLMYETVNGSIQKYIIGKGIDIQRDVDYLSDQDQYNINIISYETKLESYTNLLVDKGLIMRQGPIRKKPKLGCMDAEVEQKFTIGASAARIKGNSGQESGKDFVLFNNRFTRKKLSISDVEKGNGLSKFLSKNSHVILKNAWANLCVKGNHAENEAASTQASVEPQQIATAGTGRMVDQSPAKGLFYLKPALNNCFTCVGATNRQYTWREVMHLLRDYIKLKKIISESGIASVKTDPLGAVLGVDSFEYGEVKTLFTTQVVPVDYNECHDLEPLPIIKQDNLNHEVNQEQNLFR